MFVPLRRKSSKVTQKNGSQQPEGTTHMPGATTFPVWAAELESHAIPAELLQTRRVVSQPGDVHEREADRLAAGVRNVSASRAQRQCACGGIASADGECAACKASRVASRPTIDTEKTIKRRETGSTPVLAQLPTSVQQTINSSGQPLDGRTREFMEAYFGHDFGAVRLHTDGQATRSATDVSAQAYTVGQDVVFGAGQYAPDSIDGRQLLAHELVHTVQNRGNGGAPDIQRKPANNSQEARQYVEGVMWSMSESIRQYRRDDHIKHPERHPNTLRQDLEVMRRWFVEARNRALKELSDDSALQKRLIRVYRIYVYTAIEAFERKLKTPSWKLYQEHKDAIHELAGPPPSGKSKQSETNLDQMDQLVLPKLREARCGMINHNVEYCGNVIATPDGFRITGPLTTNNFAECGETITLGPDEKYVAYYHSHPRDPNVAFPPADPNLKLSEFDKDRADSQKIIYYLVNWNNEVLKYYPKTNEEAIHGITRKIHTFKDLNCAP